MYFRKMNRKEERLSPEIPIRATSPRGMAVRHSTIMRVVNPKGRQTKTGIPTTAERIPASITFLALNIPPKKVPVSTKFGGIM